MMTEELFLEYKSKLENTDYPNNICIIQGTIPILVSVPHAVPHIRKGEAKTEEINTDVLGFMLNANAGCHLFVNAGVGGDPNDDASSIYKDVLLQYVKEHQISMVIDIHGASSDRNFDYEVGTADGRNIKEFKECLPVFLNLASLEKKNAVVDTYFPAYSLTRIASHISEHASVPSIQLEINRNQRDSYESLMSTGHFLSKYIKGVSAILNIECRNDYRLMWVVQADMFVPRNLVQLPKELADTYGINEQLDLVFESRKEDFVIKGFGAPSGCVALTGQMISRYSCKDGYVLLKMHPYSSHRVLKPQAEDIDNEHALLSEDLYELYKDFEMLEVLNPVDNLRAYFKIKKYEGNVNKRTNSIWLSYYQRKLLGFETPPVLSQDYMLTLLSRMDPDDAAFFKEHYVYDEHNGNYVRTSSQVDVTPRLREIWNKIYSNIRFKGIKGQHTVLNQGYLMEKLIRKNTHQFRVARCAENNEIVDAVFITKSSAIALGVSELDYVWITYENRNIRTKIVIIDKEDYHKIVKANCLKSNEEMDMLVCIPMKLRSKLGIYEPGSSVMLERSVKDLFIKNAFAQLMTLLGLFIAIVTMPDLSVIHKVVIFVVLVPILMYSVLAGERNKI